jgi:hypothetical protein
MKNLNIIVILVLAIVTFASARPSSRIMIGTLIKRQGVATCLCPPTNVPCDSQNLCPASACETNDPPCGTAGGCCEQGSTCSSDANGPVCIISTSPTM